MRYIFTLDEIAEAEQPFVGGKAYNLAILRKNHMNVPKTLVIGSQIYELFVKSTDLQYQIPLALNKMNIKNMRWEELWDLSVTIDNLFLKTQIPSNIKQTILNNIDSHLGLNNLAIRSSSTFEDSPDHSFAGLHESYINISGKDNILKHIKLVWASLWSNRSLMYRNELGLSFETATMAVILQPIITGNVSGIAFSKDPTGKNTLIIEAVYGLNQALVDGSIEPDRWVFDRQNLQLVEHQFPLREKYLIETSSGLIYEKLPSKLKDNPPLTDKQLKIILQTLNNLKEIYNHPQEIEWTFKNNELYILQSRPITTIFRDEQGYESSDQRPWYLSLVRSFEDLKDIRDKVEQEYFPEMCKVSDELQQVDLSEMTDNELSREIIRRWNIFEKWKDIYWDEFIPLAHGIRLFGKIYNERVEPNDPTEFTLLLAGTNMMSTQRNETMLVLASKIKNNPSLQMKIEEKNWEDEQVKAILNELNQKIIANSAVLFFEKDFEKLLHILTEMAKSDDLKRDKKEINVKELKNNYLSSFSLEQRDFAESLLELGRDCYRLRDDDNIVLGKIEKQYIESLNEGIDRLQNRGIEQAKLLDRKAIVKFLRNKNYDPEISSPQKTESDIFRFKARQVVGNAASIGIAKGKARVVKQTEDIFEFKEGEILVVDSIEPNMTFIVPFAAGIVERRGGLLVHGAIIAREYGIPCVTGIEDATNIIKTGDSLSVDGHLGIIILQGNY